MTQQAGRYSPLGLAGLALDHARLLVLVPLAALFLSVGFTVVLGGEYRASASFTPQARQNEGARLAGLASQFGLSMGGLGGDAESVDFYARLARSRALLEQVALREYRFAERPGGSDTISGNLLAVLGIEGKSEAERMLAATRALEQMTTVQLDLNANVVTLDTRAPWPGLAEQVNRALLDEINRFNLERRQSHAAAERKFVEAQIERAQRDLDAAEGELGTFLQHNRRYEEWPQLRFEAAKLQRRVDLQQQVYTTLAQRLEQARVDEVRNTPVITIIDAPEGSAHSEASLVKNGVLSMVLGFGLVIGFLLMREYGTRLRAEHPDEYARLQARSRALLPARRNRRASLVLLPLLLPLAGLAACETETTAPVTTGMSFTAVSTGGEHSCALNEEGEAFCWGLGKDGELGTGGTGSVNVPERVETELRFRAIAAGGAHTCALTEDGSPWCWGWNAYMQRGNWTAGDGTVPVQVAGDHHFESISAGAHHTCGINAAGEAFCWGYGTYGQLGDGTYAERSFGPVPVRGGQRFRSIDAGSFHTCAVTLTGSAYCWGRNDQGQLGIGSTVITTNQPTLVAGGHAFSSISAGTNHTCAVSGNQAYCWGGNEHGQMGDGSGHRPGLAGPITPAPSASSLTFQSISAGEYVTCGVTTSGEGQCWGRGAYGQLGSGIDGDRYHPQTVEMHREGALRFRAIDASGLTHVCALSTGRSLYCWGTGQAGQLGSATSFAAVPVRVR